jgi:hypothetical protein
MCPVLIPTCSLAGYADMHGKVSERRIWHMLIDLVKVITLFWVRVNYG